MTTAAFACATCGTELRATAKFCDECGAPIKPSPVSAEYKQVTVLFADVVHSMDIAASVGPERLREIMTELVTAAAAVVQRFGGTVDKFTGDGIMAVFGAPVALEDHAFRACLAGLGIQDAARRLAPEIARRDGLDLRLRVGLNSGQVIAGEIGSGALGYTAIGEQVGMAQRMESVAAPGAVMLSTSTGRLVEDTAVLAEPELVHIKGAADPVAAYRLIAMARDHRRRSDPQLVGRSGDLNTISKTLDEAIGGAGSIIGLLGPPGIGKSRIVRESAALAASRGVPVYATYCESHTSDIPFHAVAGLLRAGLGVGRLDETAARAQVRDQIAGADPEDLLLLDDLLGVADPDTELPNIEADARRRRLTALVNSISLARSEPALFVVEDAHWMDEVSESMLADFLSVIPQTPSTEHEYASGERIFGVRATAVLVEALLRRGGTNDVEEAQSAIERLAAVPIEPGFIINDIWLLRLRALLAQACGDNTAYRGFRDRYRTMANSLGFEGHIAWAKEME